MLRERRDTTSGTAPRPGKTTSCKPQSALKRSPRTSNPNQRLAQRFQTLHVRAGHTPCARHAEFGQPGQVLLPPRGVSRSLVPQQDRGFTVGNSQPPPPRNQSPSLPSLEALSTESFFTNIYIKTLPNQSLKPSKPGRLVYPTEHPSATMEPGITWERPSDPVHPQHVLLVRVRRSAVTGKRSTRLFLLAGRTGLRQAERWGLSEKSCL